MTQIHFKHLALRRQTPATEKVRAIMSLRQQKEDEEDHGAGRRGSALLGMRECDGGRGESGVLESSRVSIVNTRDSRWKHGSGRDAKRFDVSAVKWSLVNRFVRIKLANQTQSGL